MNFHICSIDHVVLRARSAQKLVDFYSSVLGCQVERQLDIGLVQLRAGDALIDIVDANSKLGAVGGLAPAKENSAKNLDHFCLRIDPFVAEELTQHLKYHGVEASAVIEVYGAQGFGPSIYIKDPEGNTVELKGLGSKVVA